MRGYVSTDWGQLHYRASGPDPRDGGPVVVLFHESPRSSLVYEPIMAELGTHLTAFAFDTFGFGLSDSAPVGASVPEHGAMLLQAIDMLGIGTFTPVGMKTGATLASMIATLAGTVRVPKAVLYSFSEPDMVQAEYWAQNWAPALEFEADGGLFAWLWKKNVGIYGADSPRDLAFAVAETVVNIDRYNSIYPAVFRYARKTWEQNLALIEAGVQITVIEPSSAAMTPDHPLQLVRVPGTTVIKMPVTGQFASRAPRELVDAIVSVAL
jgi:pimeloyl-ACP methyl ester carboxylesterase